VKRFLLGFAVGIGIGALALWLVLWTKNRFWPPDEPVAPPCVELDHAKE
jgi:hypothetical protein